MQFLFPTLTWGFFLVLLPLVIHLINLMRQKRVRWAAMDFLLQAERKHKTWIWLKQMLLLLARMAAIALLVAMLAQLATRSQWSSFFGGRTAHHILLLDDSFSMSDRIGSASAWDRANRVVTQLAGHLVNQDSLQRFTLIRFSQARLVADNAPANDAEADVPSGLAAAADMVARTVDADFQAGLENVRRDHRASALPSDPLAALGLAAELVEQSENESHDVYLVSDYRTNQWGQPDEIVAAIGRMEEAGARVNLVRCVDNPHANLAITELRTIDGIRAAGVPMFVELVVKNFGSETVRQVTAGLRVTESGSADAPDAKATVELPGLLIEEIAPGESVARRSQVYFENPGQHVVAAELPADAVITDNRRWCVIDCADGIPVLVIDGDPEQLNARYLESVFQPSDRVRTGLRPDLREPAFLRQATEESLAKYHAIYLLDVPRLDDRATRNVERFARNGGGIAIFLGPAADLSFYNGWHAGGAGLFPVPVRQWATLPSSTHGAPDLRVQDHPLFRVLLGQRNAFIGGIRVQQYVKPADNWQPAADSALRVLAQLRNGDPLWVEQRFGDGRVVTQLSTLAPRWNSWATQPTFPVVILELQAYLNSNPHTASDLLVGTPIEFDVQPQTYQPQVEFLVPAAVATEQDSGAIKLTRNIEQHSGDGQPTERVTLGSHSVGPDAGATNQPGIYEARLLQLNGQIEQRKFALNVDTIESHLELTPLDKLADATSATTARWLAADDIALYARDDNRFSWSQVLLYGLLAVLIGEQLLGYSASYHPASYATRSAAR